MASINLTDRAGVGRLTVEEVKAATKEKLEEDKSATGYTVLYYASVYCGIKVVEAILDKNVNIDGLSTGNWTALMNAASCKKWDVVNLLLRRGANAKLLDIYKWNALHYAALRGASVDIIQTLIAAGADPETKDKYGKTPADIAREEDYVVIAEFIEQFIVPTKSANFMV
jgi:ankyrin repeat protein